MSKAIVSKDVLDTLIRAKVSSIARCAAVTPMPVARTANGSGCNWEVPGWTGETQAVARCIEEIRQYLQMLRSQFDIPAQD